MNLSFSLKSLSIEYVCVFATDVKVITKFYQYCPFRAVNILPNRLIGVVGEHEDFPVENLSKSHNGSFLASCSHDQKVKFWNIKDLPNVKVDANKKVLKSKNKQLTTAVKKDDFFSDMMENEEDEAERDDSDGDSSDEDDEGDSSDVGSTAKTNVEKDKNVDNSGVNSESDDGSEDSDGDANSDSDSCEDSERGNSDSEIRNRKDDR